LICNECRYVYLDVCFISRLRRIDASCELLDFFSEYAKDCFNSQCVIVKSQYEHSPCNHFQHNCKDINDIITDEEILLIKDNTDIDYTTISRDPVDVKILLWATENGNVAIWTCDKNLLKICWRYGISRSCFKAALKALDRWLDGDIFHSSGYNVNIMKTGDDPSFHYNVNSWCDVYCKLTECICLHC